MAHKPNFTAQLSDKAALIEVAARNGYVQRRGPDFGKGSVRAMLEAISDGRLIVVKNRALGEAELRQVANAMIDISRVIKEKGMDTLENVNVYLTIYELAKGLETAADVMKEASG